MKSINFNLLIGFCFAHLLCNAQNNIDLHFRNVNSFLELGCGFENNDERICIVIDSISGGTAPYSILTNANGFVSKNQVLANEDFVFGFSAQDQVNNAISFLVIDQMGNFYTLENQIANQLYFIDVSLCAFNYLSICITSFLHSNNTSINDTTYRMSHSIVSNVDFIPFIDVNYEAGEEIILNAGFEYSSSTNSFSATINSCVD